MGFLFLEFFRGFLRIFFFNLELSDIFKKKDGFGRKGEGGGRGFVFRKLIMKIVFFFNLWLRKWF